MKYCLLFIFVLAFSNSQAQQYPPLLSWQRSIGGTGLDQAFDIDITPDGGFVTCGLSTSTDGDFIGGFGGQDAVVIKFDADRNIQWKKKYGGTNAEYFLKIKALPDGYIVVGTTVSNNGHVSGLHGTAFDIWVVRLDLNGDITWQRCLGGTRNELGYYVTTHPSGGFIVSGSAASNDGDVTDHHVNASPSDGDAWVVHLDATGNIIWTRSYGGSLGESQVICQPTPDGGYILSCYTFSNDQDVSGNNNGDFWLVKIDASRNIVWQKCYGGNFGETPDVLIQLPDGYIMGGHTFSTDPFINNHGMGDAWIVRTDLNGNMIWQKAYGGSQDEMLHAMVLSADGGFVATGESSSSDGNTCQNFGDYDYWVFKVDANGNLLWQKSIGGSQRDRSFGVIEMPDGSIYASGQALSNDNHVAGHHGGLDYWLIKLTFPGVPLEAGISITSSVSTICPGQSVTFTATPVNGGTAPIYQWFINGVDQLVNSATFSSSTLQNGDIVTCGITSNMPCIDDPSAISNPVTITVDPSAGPSGFLPASLSKCERLPLDIIPTSAFPSYTWSTGATTPSITVMNSGTYWLEVTDQNSCKGKEFVNVVYKDCMNGVYIPKAFTPDKDGKNDIFKPVVYGNLIQYSFTIYDRAGQIILHSTDPATGWDGTYKGQKQNTNIYIWICTYQLAGEPVKNEKGTLALIR